MKTNVMRILDKAKVNYTATECPQDRTLTAVDIANILGVEPGRLFKTLVTIGKSKEHYVFVIPADSHLDLKKASSAAGEKSIEMIKDKELLPLTGYVHGGCSPIGMKKVFKTFFDISATSYPSIVINGGARGCQIDVNLEDLKNIISFNIFEN